MKIIIDNRSKMSDLIALEAVKEVITVGRISKNGTQYCYLSRASSGVMVSTRRNKKSDTFVVWDYPIEAVG